MANFNLDDELFKHLLSNPREVLFTEYSFSSLQRMCHQRHAPGYTKRRSSKWELTGHIIQAFTLPEIWQVRPAS
jgi:hypothetical protein